MLILNRKLIAGLFVLAISQSASAQLVATYQFNNTLNADEIGVPALISLNAGSFVTDMDVLGQTRTVYQRTANNTAEQSALRLDTSPLGLTANNYAVQLVFTFTDTLDSRGTGGYRRIVDSFDPSNLQDPGFYVGPGDYLNIYQSGPHYGGPALTNGTYYDVVLSVSPSGENAYQNGALAVSHTGTPDAIQSHFLSFFQDESYEYGNGKVALIRVFDAALSSNEVAALNNNGNPFPTSVPVPPAFINALTGLIPGVIMLIRRRKQKE